MDFENTVSSSRSSSRSSSSSSSSSSFDEDDDDEGGNLNFLLGCLFGGRSSSSSSEYVSVEKKQVNPSISLAVTAKDEKGTPVGGAEQKISIEESNDDEGMKHRLGTSGLPYLRLDYRWQYLEDGFDANDYLVETGFKCAGLIMRSTAYADRETDESLDIHQAYGLFRFGGSDEFFFPGSFQVGVGLGWYGIHGTQHQDGVAITTPISINPWDYFGVEFRPAWASVNERMVSDYDISMSLGYLYVQARLGYRWLWVKGDGHWLNGPYAGVSVSF